MRTVSDKTTKNLLPLSSSDSGFLYSFIVIAVLFVSVVFSAILLALPSKDNGAVILISYFLGPIAILLAIGILRYKSKVEVLSVFAENSFTIETVIATVLIFLGLTFGLSEVNGYFVSFLESLGLTVAVPTLPTKTPLNVILTVITVCVLPAVMEEFAFRGIILSGLKGCGEVFALLVSGGLFALFHMSPSQTVYQFIVGVLYSLIILKGGSLLLTVLAHFLNNFFVVMNYYYFNFTFEGTLKIVTVIIGLLCLAVGVVILLIKKSNDNIDKKTKKQNVINFVLGAVMGLVASIFMWIQGLL